MGRSPFQTPRPVLAKFDKSYFNWESRVFPVENVIRFSGGPPSHVSYWTPFPLKPLSCNNIDERHQAILPPQAWGDAIPKVFVSARRKI